MVECSPLPLLVTPNGTRGIPRGSLQATPLQTDPVRAVGPKGRDETGRARHSPDRPGHGPKFRRPCRRPTDRPDGIRQK